MIQQQHSLILSPYMKIYDLVVPQDNLLRKINELVDFSFIYDELLDKYCLYNGRNAVSPIRMFKYLLLKAIYDLSDVDIVDRSRYDMSFKYFLDMAPEEPVIDASLLTKFRKLRLKDMSLLDMLIGKTVSIAIEKGIIKSKSIIVDSTHTKSRYNQKTPREILMECSKKLRKSIYSVDESMKEKFPEKNTIDELEKEISYCNDLIKIIEKEEGLTSYPKVSEKLNLLKETLEDDIEHLNASEDKDAKIGHKSADTSFFGYKTHIAMTGERIITAATITSGEKPDGKELQTLIEKSKDIGMEIETVIGDAAYSEKDNLEYAEKEGIQLVSKLISSVSEGFRKEEDKFYYNKDAQMFVCPAGHMAVKKTRQKKAKTQNENPREFHFFDIEKCKCCQQKEGCYKEGAKCKTYSISVKAPVHTKQSEFQKSDYFKEKAKERYKIEAKNNELKHRHGYDITSYSGLGGMEMQGALAIFTVNIKRIIKLME